MKKHSEQIKISNVFTLLEKQQNWLQNFWYEIDNCGQLPQQVLDWLIAHRFFKLFLPVEWGGWEVSFADALELIIRLSAIDPNIGWLVQIGSGANFFAQSLRKDVAEEIFLPPESVIAGTGFPAGVARRVSEGYVVSGTWKYASGAQYATWFTAVAKIAGEPQPVLRAFFFPADAVVKEQDWNVIGLRGTSSWSFTVSEVFVPAPLSFRVGECVWKPDLPVYSIPFALFAFFSIAAVSIGALKGIITEGEKFYQQVESETKDKARIIRDELRLLQNHYEMVRASFLALAQFVERRAAERRAIAVRERDQLLAFLRMQFQSHRAFVLKSIQKFGMTAIRQEHPLNKLFRDFLTLHQHEIFYR